MVNLEFVPDPLRIRFTLEDLTQWSNLPDRADIIWCVPAQPIELVKQFAEYIGPRVRRLVLLGSTSAYDTAHASTDYPPPWMDETASIDLTRPRVQGEELLRREYGAIVLRVAGIYGPGRNPLDWIRTGRVVPSPAPGARGALVAPLVSAGTAFGVVTVELPDGRESSPTTQAIVTLLATQLAHVFAPPPVLESDRHVQTA